MLPLANNIQSPEIFWGLGIGSEAVTLAIMFWFFRRKRWL